MLFPERRESCQGGIINRDPIDDIQSSAMWKALGCMPEEGHRVVAVMQEVGHHHGVRLPAGRRRPLEKVGVVDGALLRVARRAGALG
jgi:hypothetical protein